DRRPMDPPPIVQLIVRNKDGSLADVSQMDVNFFMVVADIYLVDKTTPCTLVSHPVTTIQTAQLLIAGQSTGESVLTLASSQGGMGASRNLTGSTVASGNLLTNLENETGVYFVFQDISVRSEGTYTLMFSFTLPPSPGGPSTSVMATVFSEPFTIYSAKRFPGMTESTALSKCFAKQGIKIPIRKEPRVSRTKRLVGQIGGSAYRASDRDMGSDSDYDYDG
ncbi:hypothetical protein BGZ98_004415, partial [Dissophora globulifera]